jgi:endonuclease-3
MDSKKTVGQILKRLKKEYAETPMTALHFSNPFELLIATIMSAQTTDAQVNKVTEVLFKKYRSVRDFASASPVQLEKDVASVNFYRNKAKYIRATAQKILSDFGGAVPRTMPELISLPGVARKTANVVLSSAFGINEGMAVDTHVIRLSNRLKLTKHKEPEKIEADLLAITPKAEWGNLSHLLIFHGRAVCSARAPRHDACVLYDLCPSRDI